VVIENGLTSLCGDQAAKKRRYSTALVSFRQKTRSFYNRVIPAHDSKALQMLPAFPVFPPSMEVMEEVE